MSDSKSKPTVEQVPLRDTIEGRPNQKLEHTLLLDGFMVGRYSATGDMIVCELEEKPNQRRLENSSPAICFTTFGFNVISIHQNEVLQVMDVKSKKSELVKQPKGTLEGVRRIVANHKYIVAIAQKKLIVWTRSNLDKPPKEIDTTGAPTPITTVSERSSMAQEDRVVIVNNSPGGHIFQVWDITEGKLCCYAENKSKTDTFTVVVNEDGIIAATCRDSLLVWATAQHAPGADANVTEPTQKNCYSGTFLSSVYIDRSMIITGDNFGGLNVHTPQGFYLYHLNHVAISSDMADLASTNRTELASLFRTKVNKILRVGRWVFAAFENSRIQVYDLFAQNVARAADSFTHSVNGTVMRDISVYGHTVYGVAVQPADSKESKALKTGRARVDLVTWRPKVEHEDITFFYADSKLWHGSPIALVRAATHHTLVLLEKMEALITPEMHSLNMSTFKNACTYLESIEEIQRTRGILVPFGVVQNAQEVLDEYSSTLHKITKGKAAKYADQIESLRVKFMLNINICLNSAYFLLDIKNVNGTATPCGPKEFTVYRSEGDSLDDRSMRFDDFSSDDRSTRSASFAAPAAKYVPVGKDGMEGMLLSVLEDLGCAHDTTLSTIEAFDDACNKYLHNDDTDRLNPLLSIFTKLRQLDEDMKEAAKEVSKLCGQDSTDDFDDIENPITWWGHGGQYDDGAAS